MAQTVKGINIEIGAETTAFKKGLSELNKSSKDLQIELSAVNKGLKFDPTNTTLLKQKQELLTKAIDETKIKIDALKKAKDKADSDMANGTQINEKQYRELEREIVKAEQSMKSLNDQQGQVEKSLGDYGSEVKKTSDNIDKLENSTKNATETAKNFAFGVAGIATAAVTVAENTREYREDMAKLETAFTTNNLSAEQAKKVYEDFYAVLGESDRSVEAVNHLAQMSLTQQGLNDWTTIATGVWATFGDSLPIEGLTEAANETAKVGQVVGPLADALNWAGVSEDEFNQKLAAASTEQERQAIITETLNGLYGEAANKYREVNEDVLAANEAQSSLNDTMAELGDEIEPILTMIKNIISDLINAILENKDAVITAIAGIATGLLAWNVVGIITGLIGAIKGFEATTKTAAATQALFNAVMNANPIMIVVSLLAGLVAALITAYNTNEDFRNKVNAAWGAVKQYISDSVEAIKAKFDSIKEKFNSIVEWFKSIPSQMKEIGKNLIEGLWNGITDKVDWLKTQVGGVVNKIKGWFTGKDGFDTHSPSKWSEKISYWVMQGLGIGFSKNTSAAQSAKQAVGNIKNIFSEAAKASKLTLEDVQKNIESLTEKLSDYGALYTTSTNEEGNTEYQISSLENYISTLEKYQDVIDQLKGHGVSEGLLGELSNMSIDDAIGYGQKLLEMDSSSFEEYNKLWEEKQQKAKEIATELYSSELELLSTDFNGKLDSELSVLKQTTFATGSDSIQGLIDGMNSQESAAISAAKSLGSRIASALKAAKSNEDEADGSHANGLSYVPFDGYRAILHRGERVLTAGENKTYNMGNTTNKQGDININIDKVVNSSDRDINDFMRSAEFIRRSRAAAVGGV